MSTFGTRDEGNYKADCDTEFSEKDATKYRAIVARCNSLVPDRPDVAYAFKEFARSMAKPCKGDMERLKRLGR